MTLPANVYSQSYGLSSSHVWMWELDHKGGWVPIDWCFWIAVLKKTFESPLDCKETKPVNPKGNESWIFIERTDAEAEVPIIGHLMWRVSSLEKTLMLGKTEGGRRDDRGQDGWMASLTQWMWVWAGSGMWWRTGKPGVLQSTGSERVGHDWATEQQRQASPMDGNFIVCMCTCVCGMTWHIQKRLVV